MQSVSDDDVQKRLLEKPCFELAAKGVFRLQGRCYTSSGRAFQVVGPATRKARLPTVDRLTGGTRRRSLVPVERSDRLPGRLQCILRIIQGWRMQKNFLQTSRSRSVCVRGTQM